MNDLRNQTILNLVNKSIQTIWDGDDATYRKMVAEDVTFFEWYIAPDRIDGLDFHLREIKIHATALAGDTHHHIEHELLQPRVQFYGNTAIATYTLFLRIISESGVSHLSHHETRVFHNFGTTKAPEWKLVHCHKSPVATDESLKILRR